MPSQTSVRAPYQPWFSRHRLLTLGGIAVSFVLITALRFALGEDAVVGVTLFYVVSVSLAALIWGRLLGAVTVGLSLVLLAVWAIIADADLTLLGWAARIVPIAFAGLLLGDAIKAGQTLVSELIREADMGPVHSDQE